MTAPKTVTSFVESAAELLREPDPGLTPFLVDDLLVEDAIGAIVGSYKSFKSWTLAEIAVSVVTGRPAFGRFQVPKQGPVVLVMEESGRAAFHRRLLALIRGRGVDPEELAGLHFAANKRVRLDDPEWQERLLAVGATVQPLLTGFDPLVRMKAADRSENEQRDMAVALDFMRQYRESVGGAVCFVHHVGHAGSHMRGSSDLEAYWESRLGLKRDSSVVTVTPEHRETEPPDAFKFELVSDRDDGTVNLVAVAQGGRERDMDDGIVRYLEQHPGAVTKDIEQAVKGRNSDVRKRLQALDGGLVHRVIEKRPDAAGRNRDVDTWYTQQARLQLVADAG